MKLILVRHGDKGRWGAVKKLARYLSEQNFDAVFCSPAERCKETMEEIIKNREEDMAIHFSQLLRPKKISESWERLGARVDLFLEDLKCEFENQETVLVVGHSLFIRMMVYKLTGEDCQIEMASTTVFEIGEMVNKKVVVNETSYLL